MFAAVLAAEWLSVVLVAKPVTVELFRRRHFFSVTRRPDLQTIVINLIRQRHWRVQGQSLGANGERKAPSRVQGQSPWSGGQEAKPLKLKAVFVFAQP